VTGATPTDQLALMAAHFGPETAFIDLGGSGTSGEAGSRHLSFADWDAQANGIARGLGKIGVRRGDRVAIYVSAERPLTWVVSYAAVHRAGAVAVPINTRWVAAELRPVLDHAGPSVVVADESTLARVEESLAGAGPSGEGQVAPGVGVVVAVGGIKRPFARPLLSWAGVIDEDRTPYRVEGDGDDQADMPDPVDRG